jgi:hypothetical protein
MALWLPARTHLVERSVQSLSSSSRDLLADHPLWASQGAFPSRQLNHARSDHSTDFGGLWLILNPCHRTLISSHLQVARPHKFPFSDGSLRTNRSFPIGDRLQHEFLLL